MSYYYFWKTLSILRRKYVLWVLQNILGLNPFLERNWSLHLKTCKLSTTYNNSQVLLQYSNLKVIKYYQFNAEFSKINSW